MDRKLKPGDRYDTFLREAKIFREKIIKLYENGRGLNQSQLARRFGVSRQRINQIIAPTKNKAREATKAAVRNNKLPHPSKLKCVDCGRNASGYDHRDYKKPLKVDPVCLLCNVRRGKGKNGSA